MFCVLRTRGSRSCRTSRSTGWASSWTRWSPSTAAATSPRWRWSCATSCPSSGPSWSRTTSASRRSGDPIDNSYCPKPSPKLMAIILTYRVIKCSGWFITLLDIRHCLIVFAIQIVDNFYSPHNTSIVVCITIVLLISDSTVLAPVQCLPATPATSPTMISTSSSPWSFPPRNTTRGSSRPCWTACSTCCQRGRRKSECLAAHWKKPTCQKWSKWMTVIVGRSSHWATTRPTR